jgi:hypothetical protein
MSQKSSLPQVTQFVSGALPSDSFAHHSFASLTRGLLVSFNKHSKGSYREAVGTVE